MPVAHFSDPVSFNEALALGARGELTAVERKPSDIVCLQYTGGTFTGRAKGAMLSHFNVCSNSWQVLERNPHLSAAAGEIFATILPLYHIYAFCLHVFGAFSIGAHNVLILIHGIFPPWLKPLRTRRPAW